MKKEEYLILEKAVRFNRFLKEICLEDKIPHEDIVKSATKLFAEGDILAEVMGENKAEPPYEDYEWHQNIVLSSEEVIANLNGELTACYYLTPQGGAKWEVVANPNWDIFFGGRIGGLEGYRESSNRELLEKIHSLAEHILPEIPVPGSEKWEILEPWQATYWKTLPKGWRVTCQYVSSNWHIDSKTPPEWIRADEEANDWYFQISHWYTDPQFD